MQQNGLLIIFFPKIKRSYCSMLDREHLPFLHQVIVEPTFHIIDCSMPICICLKYGRPILWQYLHNALVVFNIIPIYCYVHHELLFLQEIFCDIHWWLEWLWIQREILYLLMATTMWLEHTCNRWTTNLKNFSLRFGSSAIEKVLVLTYNCSFHFLCSCH